MRPSSNAKAVEEDSTDLFESDLISNSLKGLRSSVTLIRAVRGLKNEDTPLYPLSVLEPVLPSYPMIVVQTIEDVNHYGIVISATGSEKLAKIIFDSQ